VQADASLLDPFGEQDRQPRLDAGNAVWHPAEAGAALRIELALRVVIAERAMVGGEQRENVALQSGPAGLLARFVARRRRADIHRTFHVEAFEVLGGEHEILRAGLAVDLQA